MDQLIELFNNIIDMATAGRDGVQKAAEQSGGQAAAPPAAPGGGEQPPPQA